MISKVALTTLFAVFSILFVDAQIEEVSIGAGYSQQAYYNLESGAVEVVRNDTWDIAFSNTGLQDAGVLINESAGFGEEPLKVYLAETTDWNEEITDLSPYVESARLYNPEQNWTEGAFNSFKTDSPLDYGWGFYDPQTLTVIGEKIFLIELRNGSYIKFQIQELSENEYKFRYADLNGANEVETVVSKSESDNKPLIYYSFGSDAVVSMPETYHLIFCRYIRPLAAGPDDTLQYSVTGVLLAPGVEAVVADGVDPSNVNESEYAANYSSNPVAIGHEWKFFDFDLGWIVDADRTQFVRLPNGKKFQITFFDFEGSSSGTTTLERLPMGVTSVTDGSSDNDLISVFPNPTFDYFQIKSENKENLKLELYSSGGQQILNREISPNQPITLPKNIVSGTYFMRINGKVSNQRLIVNR